jgi:hypothetical protein
MNWKVLNKDSDGFTDTISYGSFRALFNLELKNGIIKATLL